MALLHCTMVIGRIFNGLMENVACKVCICGINAHAYFFHMTLAVHCLMLKVSAIMAGHALAKSQCLQDPLRSKEGLSLSPGFDSHFGELPPYGTLPPILRD